MGWHFYTRDGSEKKAPTSVIAPAARMVQTAAQSIAANAWVQITGFTTEYDTNGLVSGNSLVIQTAGKYLIEAGIATPTTSIGAWARIKVNGVPKGISGGASNGNFVPTGTGGIASVVLSLSVGDVITFEGGQSNNAAVTTDPTQTFLSASKIDGAVVSYVGVPGSLIGKELDYSQIIAPFTGTATASPGSDAIVGNAVTYDGSTKVKLEFYTPLYQPAGGNSIFILWRDSTVIGQAAYNWASTSQFPVSITAFDTPPAGLHTYKISVYSNLTNNTINAGPGGAGQFLPAFLRITRAA